MSGSRAGSLEEIVGERLAAVRARIERACEKAGRNPADITILAVTKGFGPEAIEAALSTGIADIGENYLQEAQAKFARAAWPSPARRHFIGNIQRNKAKRIAELFDVVQTVDDTGIVAVLDAGAGGAGKRLDVLLQVNAASDARRGAGPEALAGLAASVEAMQHLRLRGLMAIGPLHGSPTSAFARAAEMFRELARTRPHVDMLSLGMSADLEDAVAAGATLVRLGTALYGPRPDSGG